MVDRATRKLAQRWMRAHGSQTEWHLRRKIAQLADWGDDAGAHLHQQLLDYCAGPAARPALAGLFGVFRRTTTSII